MIWLEITFMTIAFVAMVITIGVMAYAIFHRKIGSPATDTSVRHTDVVENDHRLVEVGVSSQIEDDPAIALSECVPPFCNVEGRRP